MKISFLDLRTKHIRDDDDDPLGLARGWIGDIGWECMECLHLASGIASVDLAAVTVGTAHNARLWCATRLKLKKRV